MKAKKVTGRRTYYYPKEEKFTIDEPKEIIQQPSGSQLILDSNGKLYYLKPSWLVLEIDTK